MDNLDIVTLEDMLQYAVIDEITKEGNTYIYLTNISDETDFCIRKLKEENDIKILVGLDDDNEFDLALKYFESKNNG